MSIRLDLLSLIALASITDLSHAQNPGTHPPRHIELLRDHWGTPHVFANTDPGAFHGLGYAAAQDRGFQMHYSLRIIKGRLAELVGDIKQTSRDTTAVDHDRKMRTFSFETAAKRLVKRLDPETQSVLEAYSEGVNAYFHQHQNQLHPAFATIGLEPEPWTPADCLLSWWHLAQFFATDGTRDLLALRNQAQELRQAGNVPPPDDSTAVVQRQDVTDQWLAQINTFLKSNGFKPPAQPAGPAQNSPKFSHAWVVDGQASGTGSAVLVSEPRTPVANPSLLYEFHVKGATFNARGIGVAGSPLLLIGWNENVAWGMTALGADQADLFRLETDPSHPEQYRFDGHWRDIEVERAQISVKGENPRPLVIRRTHLGPIVNEFAFAGPDDPLVALTRIPLSEENLDTTTTALAMMRAANIHQFHKALAAWRFPSANVVFGDRSGTIGFSLVGAIPLRSSAGDTTGGTAHDGSGSQFAWRQIIPHLLLPHVLDPARHLLLSANHRPVAAFYPIPLGTSTGSLGDTLRSWRLRELLEATDLLSPQKLLAMRLDTVNPARRAITRIGLHLAKSGKYPLSLPAKQALATLEPWSTSGSKTDLHSEGAALALEINTMFRFGNTRLTARFGGGESGLSRYLKSAESRLDTQQDPAFDPDEVAWIDRILAQAWQAAIKKYGDDHTTWQQAATLEARKRSLGYMQSLDGFPSLEPSLDLTDLPTRCPDGATIWSQNGQAYSQWVPLANVDEARSLLTPGPTERPGDPLRTVNLEAWSTGELHPAPLSRAALTPHIASRQLLD